MFYKKKISVIVPTYNVQEYLECCMESILAQTYEGLEIILIDDGSNDCTPDICEYYQNIYPQKVKYISSEHRGVGAARNLGLDNATGEYIAFVDADDTIHKNMYKELLAVADKSRADIVICDVMLENVAEQTREVQHSINFGLYNIKNYMQYGINLCSPCNKLFRKTLFTSNYFQEMTYEDTALIPVLVSYAKHVEFVKKHFYNYRYRVGSISNNVEEFSIKDFWKAITYSIEHVKEEFREELIYWHARSIVNICHTDKRVYVEQIDRLMTKNRLIFEKNKLIVEDIYVSHILNGLQKEYRNCTEDAHCMLTIISDLDTEIIKTQILKDNVDNLDIQILSTSFETDNLKICGKFILVLDDIIQFPEHFIDTVEIVDKIYGKGCNIFGIPKKTLSDNNRMIDMVTDYQKIKIDEYVYIMKRAVLDNQTASIHFTEIKFLFYGLLKNPNIYLINQLAVNVIKKLQVKENINVYEEKKKLLSDISVILKDSMAIAMGVPKFIQYSAMQSLRTLFETEYEDEIIARNDFLEYKEKIQNTLQYIEDDVIINMKKMTPEHLIFIFNMKYQCDAKILSNENGVQLFQNGNCIYIQDNTYTMLEFLEYENEVLRLEGRTICLNVSEAEDITFFAMVGGKIYPSKQLKRNCNKYCMGELLYKGIEFEVRIPISKDVGMYKIKFYYIYRGNKVARRDIRFGKFFPITKNYVSSYYKKNDRVLTYDDVQKQFIFKLCGKKGKILFEKAFLNEIKEKFSREKYREIAALRIIYLLYIFFSKKRIWMISDKAHRGDDNGEAFFRYMSSNSSIRYKVRSYYLMDKTSPDYFRLKKIGRIVHFNSFKHKLLSLICEYHFTAYANDALTKPLLIYKDCFKDIMNREWIVFLQHGPTQNNVSSALNKYNQNFHSIISINEREREAFINYNYYYRDDQIKLAGFPRYDYLFKNEKKYITIAPTWRRTLFGMFIPQEERFEIKENFKDSEYYAFFCKLVNSAKLHKVIKKFGYELHFIPHPVFFPYIDKFEFNSEVIIHGVNVSYNQIFAESNLFITDYSSAAFDFAYLKKPVIYTQFDQNEFYSSQYKRGMFDYKTEGFGPVLSTVDETVNEIIKYIETNCSMQNVYRKRVETYFAYHDKNNCERIFEIFYG